jgi:peptidyl-prolyl cis-trans isomerase C
MSRARCILMIVGASALPLRFTGCEKAAGDAGFTWQPVFGDNSNDTTPVVARVAGVEITEQDLDLRYDELPDNMKSRYKGAEGRRLLLKEMADQVLLVRGAVDRELYNERNVARQLISLRRMTLDQAMRSIGLLADAKPSEQELQEYFQANRDQYRQLGAVMAQHIECLTREEAQAAYDRLLRGGAKDKFPYVVADYSVNGKTRETDGVLGWFNKGGFVPYVENTREFTTKAYELEDGLNPPVLISGRWHVIEILKRERERPMTFAEARDQVLQDYMPRFEREVIDAYLAEARAEYQPELLGEYAPGRGLTPEEILARAMALPDGQDKLDLFLLIQEDFPQSDRADDALFLAAQVSLDKWSDRAQASRYLHKLLTEYPESELAGDARYMMDNLENPNFVTPKSIEDLRR